MAVPPANSSTTSTTMATFNRTFSDIMEDELYSPQAHAHGTNNLNNANYNNNNNNVSNNTPSSPVFSPFSQSQAFQSVPVIPSQRSRYQQMPQLQSQGGDDLSAYLHLNGSQDSLDRIVNSAFNMSSGSGKSSPMKYTRSEPASISSSDMDGSVFSDSGNPDAYTRTGMNGDLYELSLDPTEMAGQESVPTKRYDEMDDEVMLVPQDSYMYDQQDAGYYPDVLQFELNAAKPFPQSNELNIFRSNDLYVDDEYTDEDEDDDMGKDFDDVSSVSSDEDYEEQETERPGPQFADNYNNYGSAVGGGNIASVPPAELMRSNPHSRSGDSLYSLAYDSAVAPAPQPSFAPQSFFQEPAAEPVAVQSNHHHSFDMPDVANEAIQRRNSAAAALSVAPAPVVVKKPQQKKRAVSATVAAVAASSPDEPRKDVHICQILNPKTGLPCNKRFSRPYDLVRHQNTIHASKRSYYRCMFCEDDLRRKHQMDSVNPIVVRSNYRNTSFSAENSNNNMANSHNSKKVRAQSEIGGYLSNKTFSRCDALTRHLRFRHGLNNDQVNDAMEFAKKHVEYYEN